MNRPYDENKIHVLAQITGLPLFTLSFVGSKMPKCIP